MSSTTTICELIDSNGNFNENFEEKVKLAKSGSYFVVSIMGPQSSGKSTLLNHLFETPFKVMDALEGRYRTTKGIWLSSSRVSIEPLTLVLDLEGTDGAERGEDDTAFEKQSALFALAVSDVVLINMWCHDIGREHAANKPLLRIVFQARMRLFGQRKATLMLVIRDKTKTPFGKLEQRLKEDIQMIWDSVPKAGAQKDLPLSQIFKVEVVALSRFEEDNEPFKEQVASLRERFRNPTAPGGIAEDRHGVVPASAFSLSMRQIWKAIIEDKDLDLPAHRVMVATVRCQQIADAKHKEFKDWLQLEKAAALLGPVTGFGKRLNSIIGNYLSAYDLEAQYFDADLVTKTRNSLKRQLLQELDSFLCHLRFNSMEQFKKGFHEALNEGKEFDAAFLESKESVMLRFDEECADAIIDHGNKNELCRTLRSILVSDIDTYVVSVHRLKSTSHKENRRFAMIAAESVNATLKVAAATIFAVASFFASS